MAFTFVVEDGSADSDANSYCTVDFADDYIAANAYASDDWDALDTDQKEKLLVRSSRIIDVRFLWNGQRVDQDSGLKWPRSGAFDEDNFQICDDVIPIILQQAVAEFAGYLMGEDWTTQRDSQQYREVQVDVIDIKYNTDFRRAYVPDTIVQMLLGLGSVNSGKRPAFKRIIRS